MGVGLDRFGEVPPEVLQAAALSVQGKAQRIIRDEDRVDKGNLMSNFSVEATGKHKVTLTNEAPYAFYHEFGTGIYHEKGQGRKTPWVFYSEKLGTYVTTRGIRPIAFMRRAVDEGGDDARKAAAQALSNHYASMDVGGGGAMRSARGRSKISGIRGILYQGGKELGDISALMGGGHFSGLRSSIYGGARGLGDVSALLKGPSSVGGRIVRRIVGRQTGGMMASMRQAGGSPQVGRLFQRGAGKGMGGMSRRFLTSR